MRARVWGLQGSQAYGALSPLKFYRVRAYLNLL